MTKIERLLNEYGESHKNPINKILHWFCVPVILISLLGLIVAIPVPDFFKAIHLGDRTVNWAIVFVFFAMIYYFSLSLTLALGMIIVVVLLSVTGFLISAYIPLPLWKTSLIMFSLAWIGQFWGHKIEGKKPSFLKDIQFLLIGPVWLLSFIYKKLGITYTLNKSFPKY